jgi:hypothetical protein
MVRSFGMALAVAIAASPAAHARTWYIFDAPNDRCALAAAMAKKTGLPVTSPGEMADATRRDPSLPPPDIHVVRNDAGEIVQATVASGLAAIVWYATAELCLKSKDKLEGAGSAASPDELH